MQVFPNGSPARIHDISAHYPQVQRVHVLRLDEIHPVISGNKWYKLRYYLDDAKGLDATSIVTMGGPWSNHIVATAAAAKASGFKSIGIIRGEEPATWSTTLQQARDFGMEFHFISRHDFDNDIIPETYRAHPYYFIPAGGRGRKGAEGAATIMDAPARDYTHIACAVGTGTMLAGLIRRCRTQQLMGFSALKDHPELEEQITGLCGLGAANWSLNRDFHFGGYARYKPELIRFMNEWYDKTGIPSDFVYTGKLFFAFHALTEGNYFPSDAKVLLIHSGGLQGNRSLPKGLLSY